MKNLFYFQHLNSIGGIEQFFAYLSEKYRDWDITIVYKTGDPKQIARLRKYVRVIKFSGQLFTCDKAFFCFNTEIRPNVHAKEYNLILHGDYATMVEQGQLSRDCYIFNEVFDNYLGVSKLVCDSWTKCTGKPCKLVYNPFIKEPPKKLLKLVYCGRLSSEKGGDLVSQFMQKLDENLIDYKLFVYSNQQPFRNDNVIYMGTRLDAGTFLNKSNYDFMLVSSKNEGYCYSLVQSLSNGLPVIATPCPVFKELGLNEKNSITLNFDCSNVNEVIECMLNDTFNFKYNVKKDTWDKILEPGESVYKPELVTLKCTRAYYDMELEESIPLHKIYVTTRERADLIISHGYAIECKETTT